MRCGDRFRNSGLVSVCMLSREHEVVLFEAADTSAATLTRMRSKRRATAGDRHGFIVHNPAHLSAADALLRRTSASPLATDHDVFRCKTRQAAWSTTPPSLDALFCQRRNLLSLRFRHAALIRAFIASAPEAAGDRRTTSRRWATHPAGHIKLGAAFPRRTPGADGVRVVVPPPAQILAFLARYLVQFMANHCMLQITGRPDWRVVWWRLPALRRSAACAVAGRTV